MKKRIFIVFVVVLALLASLALAACGGKDNDNWGNSGNGSEGNADPNHIHTFAGTYQRNDSKHWLKCTNCDVVDDSAHDFNDGNKCVVCGYEFTAGLAYRDIGSDACAVKGIGSATAESNIVIPIQHDGRTVVGIDDYAFYHCLTVRNITIPSTIRTIGDYVLYDCTELVTVDWNATECTQGDSTFGRCNNLKTITVDDNVKSLPRGVFNGISPVNVTLPFIGGSKNSNEHFSYIFSTSDTNSYVPNSIQTVKITNTNSIGAQAFSGCSSIETISIPESVTSIGDNAFEGCNYLKNIYVVDSNKAYCSLNGILYNYAKTEIIHVPQKINGAVTIPNGVTSIGDNAFRNCQDMTSISIPNSITSIGEYAFYGCKFTSIAITKNITSIGVYAFSSCTDLNTAIFEDTNGWEVKYNRNSSTWTSISSSRLADSGTAAYYLQNYYADYEWRKS